MVRGIQAIVQTTGMTLTSLSKTIKTGVVVRIDSAGITSNATLKYG